MFAVVLWEIFSFGKQPWQGLHSRSVSHDIWRYHGNNDVHIVSVWTVCHMDGMDIIVECMDVIRVYIYYMVYLDIIFSFILSI